MHFAKPKTDSLGRAVRALLARPPAAIAMLGLPGIVLAGPTGEDVIRGRADVHRPDANNTIIDQHTERAVINWQTFNVDADEFVTFNQAGASSIVLNRVLGGDMSRIFGQMQANGQVFLLNPHGVFFADGATLDVQGFLGSTLDMDPDGFMAGNYALTRNPNAPANASVVNDGRISTGPGGYVVLAGDFTENTGIISANAGTVALVSGNALTLDIEGDGLVSFTVDEATLAENAGVRNAGNLVADGGMVVMTAKVANSLVATAVNNEGLVRAHAVEQHNGEIYLIGNGGDVANSGTLDADGDNANGGGIGIYSDRDVVLHDGAVQTAAGDANHAGGIIRAIAEEHLDYRQDNVIRVTGGTSGGFVEVSGHGSLALRGTPQIGAGGTFLIDPQNIHIRNNSNSPSFSSGGTSGSITSVGAGYLETQLADGTNVLLVATNSIRYTDTSAASINVTGNNAGLTVAIGQINATGGATDPGSSDLWAGNIFLGGTPTYIDWTNGSIDLANLDINIGGDITLDANQGTIKFNRLATTNGNIAIDAGSGFGTISGGAGGIDAAGSVDIGTLPGIPSYGGDVTLNGAIDAGGDIDIAGNRVATAGLRGNNIHLTIAGDDALLNVGGNVNANGSASLVNNAINISGSADIAVSGNISAGGIVTVDGTNVHVNGINATSVDVRIKGSGASFTATGNIVADNNATIMQYGQGIADIATRDVQASRVWIYADGFIETGNLDALGSLATSGYDQRGIIHLYAGSGIETGALHAVDDVLGATVDLNTSFGAITVHGDITAHGGETPFFGITRLDAFTGSGDILIDGDIAASGYGGPGDGSILPGVGAGIYTGNGSIDITGGVDVTGHAIPFSSNGQSIKSGNVAFDIYATNGDTRVGGAMNFAGVGNTRVDIYGANVTTGDITVTANPESFTTVESEGFQGGTETRQETALAAGLAELHVASGYAVGNGAITVGNVSVKGPDARVSMNGARNYATGGIAVRATGNDITSSYTQSYGGSVTSGGMVTRGGFAELVIGEGSGATDTHIDINGAINVEAKGRGGVALLANTVETRSINVTATAGEFSRNGSGPAGGSEIVQCDGPCPVGSDWPYDGDFGGPRIDTGTVVGGAAEVFIGNASSYGGMLFADKVTIDGNLAVSAPGQAEVSIRGNDIAVSGTIDATATRATVNGSYTDSGSTAGGGSSFISGTVESSIGRANVELQGLDSAGHAVRVAGAISVSGPRANFNAGGGDVTLGNLSVTASGFTIDADETAKDVNGNVIGGFHFEGGHLVTGVGVEGTGDVRVGDVRLEGPGATGIIFRGATVTTGNINVRATAGEFTTTAPDFNGGATATVATGAAVLGFESPATATVNGNLVIEGARTAHLGGRVDASGDLVIRGGSAVLDALPGYVDFLDRLGDDGDTGDDPLELPAAAVRAANIAVDVTNGNLALGTATLRASENMTFTAGGGINLGGRSFTLDGNFEAIAGAGLNASGTSIDAGTIRLEAGNDLSVSNVNLAADAVALVAGRDISNSNPAGRIDAGALAILAGRNVDLSNTTLAVGDGRIASVPGDTRFLELLAVEGLAVPSGGPNLVVRARNVALGGGTLAGDYAYLEANRISVASGFSSSNPDLLLQVAPLSTNGSFGLEQASAGGGDAAYVYDNSLAAFGAGTIALGSTSHNGNVRLSVNSANVNIGDTNLFVLTNGNVAGLERVLSTGIVKDLATLLGGNFNTPQTDEIDFSQDPVQKLNDTYALDDDRGGDEDEGDEEGEDTDTDTGVEEEDDSLIRRETSEEEMMCR